ncbi:hypothetical protein Daus18300_009966 [Diaporthe australafricana]|uniref:non-specific serine/threonine protein kinase n=1 Tax=Diaporthe australafricana TaxID=127596 RepID=A0ABR3WC92_9PEZI
MASSTMLAPPALSQPSAPISAAPGPASAAAATSTSEPTQDDCSLSSSSPSQFATNLSNPIYEESDEDSESVAHNEPVTPVSGRQSSEFRTHRSHDNQGHPDITDSSLIPFPSIESEAVQQQKIDLRKGPFANHDFEANINTQIAVDSPAAPQKSPASPRKSISTRPISPPSTARTSADESQSGSLKDSRRSTRGSTHSFKRTMSNLFKRNGQQGEEDQPVVVVAHQDNLEANRRWSMHRSTATTPGSNTPPSPGTQTGDSKQRSQNLLAPTPDDFLHHKKNRASTGLTLRNRAVNFATGNGRNTKKQASLRRASSFDGGKDREPQDGQLGPAAVFYARPEAGVGVKARRLSLSLPDELTIDVVDLLSEFEYKHKHPFARHMTRTLGKGASGTVRIMSRKGFPEELYAVKCFRTKDKGDTKEEYEKKIKSEYSLAKSLHHPNVVETVRLCIDHGRWNHVMEYCSEGDLHGLLTKKYLSNEDREKDRLCLFKQLVQGLNYLHCNGIAHRDIKPENLLLTSDSKLKITDFGVTEVFSGIHPAARESGGECGREMGEVRMCPPGICGSQPYMAPEVLARDRKYDPRMLDVWSAACVMINLMTSGRLWEKAVFNAPGCAFYDLLVRSFDKWNAKNIDGSKTIAENDYPAYLPFDQGVNRPALRRVLLMMLNPNPEKRATIHEIANIRFMKNIQCCQPESYDDPDVVIDATKSASFNLKTTKTFCHNHLPPKWENSHSLPPMPGKAGY